MLVLVECRLVDATGKKKPWHIHEGFAFRAYLAMQLAVRMHRRREAINTPPVCSLVCLSACPSASPVGVSAGVAAA